MLQSASVPKQGFILKPVSEFTDKVYERDC